MTWSTTTNAEGWATWNEAPEDDVQYSIFIKDRMSLRNEVLRPDTGDAQQVKLLPVLKISGRVTDAETGAGIEDYKVIYGLSFQRPSPQNQISWEREGKGPRALRIVMN